MAAPVHLVRECGIAKLHTLAAFVSSVAKASFEQGVHCQPQELDRLTVHRTVPGSTMHDHSPPEVRAQGKWNVCTLLHCHYRHCDAQDQLKTMPRSATMTTCS